MILFSIIIAVIAFFILVGNNGEDGFLSFLFSILIGLAFFIFCFLIGLLSFEETDIEVIDTSNIEIISLYEINSENYKENDYIIFNGKSYIFYVKENGFIDRKEIPFNKVNSIKYNTDNKAFIKTEKYDFKSSFQQWYYVDYFLAEKTYLIIPKDSEIKYIISELEGE